MSASDAAPLPRLGEVFFDVRGDSRSMRLSWYADTDVAVFSIWQGGKCTGTFRLPMDDLGRMIEILQRGPDRRSGQRPGERGGGFSAGYEPDRGGPNRGGGYDADNTMVHGSGSPGSSQYGIPDDHAAADHGPGDYGPGDYDPRDRRPSDYDPRDRGPGDYGDAGYRGSESRAPRHRTERYEPADYGRPDYEEEPPREWWQDSDYADRTGQRFVPGDEARYGQQRFEPPNRRPRPDSSERGFMDDPEYRQPADPASRPRHSAGRHSGGQGQ